MRREWEPHVTVSDVVLVGGSTLKGPALVMRRRVGDVWEYREPTPEEAQDYVNDEAW